MSVLPIAIHAAEVTVVVVRVVAATDDAGVNESVVAGVPAAAARVRDVIAQRFDQRYADAIEFLVTARAALLSRGEPDGWRALADDVVSQDFCDLVEGGEFEKRMTPWR